MFKKKNKMLLASAILIALSGMNTAYADDCLDTINANLADGDDANNPSSISLALCGNTLNSTPGTDPSKLIELANIVANNPAYSASAANALASDDEALALAGAATFTTILNSPAISGSIKAQAAALSAKVIADNAATTLDENLPTNDTIKKLLIQLEAANPGVVATAVATAGVGATALKTFIESDAFIADVIVEKNTLKLSASISGSIQKLGTQVPPSIYKGALGQVLVFPYYTTRGDKKSIINVFNTSGRTVVAKIRFHESHNSRDVLDFIVVLSPYDKWSGSIREENNAGPRFVSNDSTCTVPAIPAEGKFLDETAYNSTSTGDTDADQSKDRLREGYVEVIAMGDATEAILNSNVIGIGGNAGTAYPAAETVILAGTDKGNVAYYAKHVKNGTETKPRDCDAVAKAFAIGSKPIAPLNNGATGSPLAVNQFRPLLPGNNPLRGALTIISETNGVGFGTSAMAIADFNNSVNLIAAQKYPYHLEPTIASRDGLWTTSGLQAVEDTISYKTVINEWANNSVNGANTDWVIQFPTKAFHVDAPYANKATETGCKDDNFQAARNKYRGNLNCAVNAAGDSAAVTAAEASVAAKTIALSAATSVQTAATAAKTTADTAKTVADVADAAAPLLVPPALAAKVTADAAVDDAVIELALKDAALLQAINTGTPADVVDAQADKAVAVIALNTANTNKATKDAAYADATANVVATAAAVITTTNEVAVAAAAVVASNTIVNTATAELSIANAILIAAKLAADSVDTSKYVGNFGSFENRFGSDGSLVTLRTEIIDKEENKIGGATDSGVEFSPSRPQIPNTPTLPWESNIITFSGQGGVSVMSSDSPELELDPVASTDLTETNGMAMISFIGAKGKGTLPVIGFVAKQRSQGNASLSFGQLMGHSFK